ncbi:MAG: hypothetical protein R3B06_32390 [Kofleriaceae bacterium]
MTIHHAHNAIPSAQPWCAYSLPAALEANGPAAGGCERTSMVAFIKAIDVGGSLASGTDRKGPSPGALS